MGSVVVAAEDGVAAAVVVGLHRRAFERSS